MKRNLVAAIALLFLSQPAEAAGWTSELTVSSAFIEGTSDFVVIYTSDADVYTPGCTANSWHFVADSEARRGRVWSTILTALATGQKIKLWYNDTCLTWGFHWATSLMLVK